MEKENIETEFVSDIGSVESNKQVVSNINNRIIANLSHEQRLSDVSINVQEAFIEVVTSTYLAGRLLLIDLLNANRQLLKEIETVDQIGGVNYIMQTLQIFPHLRYPRLDSLTNNPLELVHCKDISCQNFSFSALFFGDLSNEIILQKIIPPNTNKISFETLPLSILTRTTLDFSSYNPIRQGNIKQPYELLSCTVAKKVTPGNIWRYRRIKTDHFYVPQTFSRLIPTSDYDSFVKQLRDEDPTVNLSDIELQVFSSRMRSQRS